RLAELRYHDICRHRVLTLLARSLPLKRERLVDQLPLLLQVARIKAGRRGGGLRASHVSRARPRGADRDQDLLQARLHEGPGAHVPRLLLAPHELGLLEARQLGRERVKRAGIELLEPEEIDLLELALLELFQEIVIDLARAQD